MSVTLQVPLDMPEVRLLSTERTEKGELLLKVESARRTPPCRVCGRELEHSQGQDRPIRLRHLPILEQAVYLEIRLHSEYSSQEMQVISGQLLKRVDDSRPGVFSVYRRPI